MQLSAILQARVIAFFNVYDVSPRTGLFFPDITKELVQRFNFQRYPKTLDEWQDPKGSQFGVGKLGDVTVDALILFNNGIQLDTHAGTKESKAIIEDTLEWAKDRLGFTYAPGAIKQWAYVSSLTFLTAVPILSTPPLDNLAQGTSRALSEIMGEPIVYQTYNQTVAHDPLSIKYGRASFYIQRRLDVPFGDNKYFSEAPLPTEVHWDLLTRFEADVMATFQR